MSEKSVIAYQMRHLTIVACMIEHRTWPSHHNAMDATSFSSLSYDWILMAPMKEYPVGVMSETSVISYRMCHLVIVAYCRLLNPAGSRASRAQVEGLVIVKKLTRC
jgi:hypothetical protein